MSAPKIPAPSIYTAKVEALLKLASDFTEADFLALACAAADQAGADPETGDRIHELVTADMDARTVERERWAEDERKSKAQRMGACPVCGETNKHVCGVTS